MISRVVVHAVLAPLFYAVATYSWGYVVKCEHFLWKTHQMSLTNIDKYLNIVTCKTCFHRELVESFMMMTFAMLL